MLLLQKAFGVVILAVLMSYVYICRGMTELYVEVNLDSDENLVTFNTAIEAHVLSLCAHRCLNTPGCYQLSHNKQENICLLSVCSSSSTAEVNLNYTSVFRAKSKLSRNDLATELTDQFLKQIRSCVTSHTEQTANGKPTNNSEEYIDHDGAGFYAAHKGVDGIYDARDFGLDEYLSVVLLEPPNPWLIIDLESDYCVEAVKVFTRFQLSDQHCEDMLIEIAPTNNPTGYNHCALREGEILDTERINCIQPIVGRYVKVSFTASVLQNFYEIEIIGH